MYHPIVDSDSPPQASQIVCLSTLPLKTYAYNGFPGQDANLEAQSQTQSQCKPKSDLGGQLGGPKLTQEANLEGQGGQLRGPKTPRTPTWRPKGPPGGRLGGQRAAQDANLERKCSEKGAQMEPRGSQNEAQEPT